MLSEQLHCCNLVKFRVTCCSNNLKFWYCGNIWFRFLDEHSISDAAEKPVEVKDYDYYLKQYTKDKSKEVTIKELPQLSQV